MTNALDRDVKAALTWFRQTPQYSGFEKQYFFQGQSCTVEADVSDTEPITLSSQAGVFVISIALFAIAALAAGTKALVKRQPFKNNAPAQDDELSDSQMLCLIMKKNDMILERLLSAKPEERFANELSAVEAAEIVHESHPHVLKKTKDVYGHGRFGCDICGEVGTGWVYHCDRCNYDAHPKCVALPPSGCNSVPDRKCALRCATSYECRFCAGLEIL